MKVTEKKVFKDFDRLKINVKECYEKNKLNEAIEYARVAAKLMYYFNFIYTDDDLENFIKLFSKKVFQEDKFFVENEYENRVVFYDYFSLDNRGLSEQYLRALVDLNYEILYITLQHDKTKMVGIKTILEENKNNKIYFVSSKDSVEKIKEIREQILKYKPSKIFNHTVPEDICGMVALENIGNKIERYLINLTDHAFWLGKSCSDYFIEFRSYGKNISKYYRKIEEEKSIILPYYPIENKNIEFQGFPFEIKNKKLIFSGGSLYKIYGSEVFFELVRYILDNHKDTIFLYLGNGDSKPIEKFIRNNKYENRFYYYKERKDINEVFKRCYFYLGTYPVTGALMSQFAVVNKKIPLQYSDKEILCNRIEELFINSENIKFTFGNIEEIKEEIDKLICSKKYFEKKSNELNKMVITPLEFSKQLEKLLKCKKTDFKYEDYSINIKKFSQIYLEQENKFLKQYLNIFSNKVLKKKFLHYYLLKKLKKFI